MKISILFISIVCFSISLTVGQLPGTQTTENHLPLTTYQCTSSGGCTTSSTSVVLDANWRWIHDSSYTNCYTGTTWSQTDPNAAAENCYLEGVSTSQYESTYGITSSGSSLTLDFITATSNGPTIGSRTYLMQDDETYQYFYLKNQEFSFDVDVSTLACGINGALYFVDMESDGSMATSVNGQNKAGAKFGTGYCDAQCPQDVKFINGQANLDDWTPVPGSSNSGTGRYGSCCIELDVWEANKVSAAFTPHPCSTTKLQVCDSTTSDCGNTAANRYSSICDKDGCDFNSYRMGDQTFYGSGSGFTIDTTQKITVVTQFLTTDGTSAGDLSEIKRFYVQNGVVIDNSAANFADFTAYDSITDQFCTDQKTLFGDTPEFIPNGGLAAVGEAMGRGLVLVMSIWDDYAAEMLWLDSNDPATGDPSTPGVARGTCSTSSGVPAQTESQYASASVTYSNIKVGDIGSTSIVGSSTSSSNPATSTSGAKAATSTSGAKAATSSTAAKSATSTAASGASSTAAAGNGASSSTGAGAGASSTTGTPDSIVTDAAAQQQIVGVMLFVALLAVLLF